MRAEQNKTRKKMNEMMKEKVKVVFFGLFCFFTVAAAKELCMEAAAKVLSELEIFYIKGIQG